MLWRATCYAIDTLHTHAHSESQDTKTLVTCFTLLFHGALADPAVHTLPTELPAGQLPSLAAAHLQAYAALIDCQMRIPMLPADSMLVPASMLTHAVQSLLGSAEALSNTATTACVVSALTSLVKRAVGLIRASAALPADAAAAADPAACFSAAAQVIARDCVQLPAAWMSLAPASDIFAVHGSRSAGNSQAAASAALLAVVLARNVVQLADAMEAAGPAVCARGSPKMRWVRHHNLGDAMYLSHSVSRYNMGLPHSVQTHWQAWQVYVPRLMRRLLAAFRCAGIAPPEAATGDLAVTATSTGGSSSSSAGGGDPMAAGGSSSSSSASSNQQVKWGYMLRLQQINPQWAAAMAAYEAKQQDWEEVTTGAPPSSAAAAADAKQRTQQCTEAIELCRALVAAAPVTVICNNPSCENLGGVSEAAAACKACVGCGCRYCCVACQRSDWKRHKQACRLLAAAGVSCA
jgi:hypothetical protein